MIRFFNGRTLTMADGVSVTTDEVWTDGDKIAYIGPTPEDLPAFERQIDLGGDLVMPGFKNAHAHAGMSFVRSYADDVPLQPWLFEQIFPLEAKLTPEAVYAFTKLSILEYLTSGITAGFDMYYFREAIAQASIDCGFRTVLCGGGGSAQQLESEYRKFNALHPLISYQLGLHSEYTSNLTEMTEAGELARALHAPVFAHNAETAREVAECRGRWGKTPTELFESLGVELKVERGRRVFPVSDKAEEIRQALLRYAQDADIVYDGAKKLLLEDIVPEAEPAPAAAENPRHPKKKKAGPALRCVGVRGVSGREYRADAVLVATGGVSYPTTGSTGDGYKLAQQAGHTLVEPVPSLVSLVSHDPDCKKMMGLALKNVTLTLFEDGKGIFEEQGEMLFTHFGISGPLTLSASSHLGDMKKHKYHAEIDLKPALSEEQLYDRITRDFALLANHAAQGALVKLLPASMQPVMVARWGIDPATKANQITREQKRELVRLMKHWNVPIDARGDLAHAVITSGGVSVREVDPRTMQSKKALGLYFAGEVLDVDAYTGGYNLQIAFCTAQSFANHL